MCWYQKRKKKLTPDLLQAVSLLWVCQVGEKSQWWAAVWSRSVRAGSRQSQVFSTAALWQSYLGKCWVQRSQSAGVVRRLVAKPGRELQTPFQFAPEGLRWWKSFSILISQNGRTSQLHVHKLTASAATPRYKTTAEIPASIPCNLLDVSPIHRRGSQCTIPNKMCKNIKYSKKCPVFLNKHHICHFKHCLQMFMHIISLKYGPAAAGIRGALYTERVQMDHLRYRFF